MCLTIKIVFENLGVLNFPVAGLFPRTTRTRDTNNCFQHACVNAPSTVIVVSMRDQGSMHQIRTSVTRNKVSRIAPKAAADATQKNVCAVLSQSGRHATESFVNTPINHFA